MEISKLKELCRDESEIKTISFIYSHGIKGGEPFGVNFVDKKGHSYMQIYDGNGIPRGAPQQIINEEIYYDYDIYD